MDEQLDALLDNKRIRLALGEEMADVFRAVRRSDEARAADLDIAEVIKTYRWLY